MDTETDNRKRLTSGQGTWRTGCGESRTSGSAGGLGKRVGSNPGTRPRPTQLVAVGGEQLALVVGVHVFDPAHDQPSVNVLGLGLGLGRERDVVDSATSVSETHRC